MSMFVRFLFVFDLLFNLFRIALWPSVGKELSPWLFTCAFYFSAVLIIGVPFPFGVWGRIWNPNVSVSDQCLFIYFLSSIKFVKKVRAYIPFVSSNSTIAKLLASSRVTWLTAPPTCPFSYSKNICMCSRSEDGARFLTEILFVVEVEL